jgi:hypothetical protein
VPDGGAVEDGAVLAALAAVVAADADAGPFRGGGGGGGGAVQAGEEVVELGFEDFLEGDEAGAGAGAGEAELGDDAGGADGPGLFACG